MATVTKPIALDESINTTEGTSRNIADVLAQELANIATSISGGSDKAPKTDIATVEPTNVASRAYNIGELVYVNGNLYKVITAISGGATFTVGTNIQSANVSGVLKDMRQPRTVITPVITGTGVDYITFAHDFPKNVVGATMTKVIYIGLPAQPPVSITVYFDKSVGTDWAVPYASMMNNIRVYATLAELEITYS